MQSSPRPSQLNASRKCWHPNLCMCYLLLHLQRSYGKHASQRVQTMVNARRLTPDADEREQVIVVTTLLVHVRGTQQA